MASSGSKWKSIIIFLIVPVLLTSFLPRAAMAVRDIVITSGTQRGTWYPVSVLLADILDKNITGIRVTVIEGGGASNPGRVNSGKDADLGYTYADTFLNAFHGRKEFQNKPMPNLRAMLATSITNYSILVRADSDIKKFTDLLNKRFAVALPGQGPELLSRKVLEAYGLSYENFPKSGGKIVHTETAEMAGLMKDGHVDAVACMGPFRHSIGIELEAWRKIRVISLDEDKIKKFLELWPGFIRIEIPANTYKDQEKPAASIGSVVFMMCHKDMPDDLIYKITKVTLEKGDIINKQYKDYSISLRNAISGLPEKYFHPAALRYIKEATGK